MDTSATHIFVSEQIATSLHCNPGSSKTTFKVVNSAMKSTTRVVRSTPLKVGQWFDSLDFTMVPLDEHTIILG